MEVIIPSPAPPLMDFNFHSACSSPYTTAPSSPHRFANFIFSAPTSPSRASAFYHDLHDLDFTLNSQPRNSASVPFKWEEKPGTPKPITNSDEDFEFDVSGQVIDQRTSLSAAELFHGGKIKPVKPPPYLQLNNPVRLSNDISSPRSSPRSKILNHFSPRQRVKEFDPFEAVLKETQKPEEKKRGRERSIDHQSSSSSSTLLRKASTRSRSLSPLRFSQFLDDQEDKYSIKTTKSSVTSTTSTPNKPATSILSSISFSKGKRKWRLKDLLLFRSASEGRATDKDLLRKYSGFGAKKVGDEVKNSSFRSIESASSVSSSRRREIRVSAHEFHYTVNRAVSEEMRKKTFLPYKQGLLGCLGFNFNPSHMHEISRKLGSFTR